MTPNRLRHSAVHYLIRIFHKGAFLNILLTTIRSSDTFTPQGKSYLVKTLTGVVIWKRKLDWIVRHFSSVPVQKLERKIYYYILTGIYNLIDCPELPHYSVINEVVEAVKREKGEKTAGFVNGVLRSVQRDASRVQFPDRESNPVGSLAVRYSHPDWMVKRWYKRYGYAHTEELCQWNNSVQETTIRLNTLKPDINRFLAFCRENNCLLNRCKQDSRFYRAANAGMLIHSRWFREGYFTIQTLSSGLPAIALNPEQNATVVDICAAPGGKATLLAELMQNTGKIVAIDIHLNRLHLLKDAVRRLGISTIYPVCADSTTTQLKEADYILIDAPCSGLGTLRLKPDIRWKRTEEQIKELTLIQRQLLENASRSIKPGGVIVYSTCTIEPEENEGVVQEFVQSHSAFRLAPLDEISSEITTEGQDFLSLLPFEHHLDGSFIAKIRRIM